MTDTGWELFLGSLQVEPNHHFFANQIVGLAWILHSKIESIDRKLRCDCYFFLGYPNFGRKSDSFGDSVHGQVAANLVVVAFFDNALGLEGLGWKFFGVEELITIEMLH